MVTIASALGRPHFCFGWIHLDTVINCYNNNNISHQDMEMEVTKRANTLSEMKYALLRLPVPPVKKEKSFKLQLSTNRSSFWSFFLTNVLGSALQARIHPSGSITRNSQLTQRPQRCSYFRISNRLWGSVSR